MSAIEDDLKRLEEINEEALHPTSPTPGHAEGCPCHRCRTYREERDVEKAFEFLRISQ